MFDVIYDQIPFIVKYKFDITKIPLGWKILAKSKKLLQGKTSPADWLQSYKISIIFLIETNAVKNLATLYFCRNNK